MLKDQIINNYGYVARIPGEGIIRFQIPKAFARQIFNDPVNTDELESHNGLMLRRPVENGIEQVVLAPQRIETQTVEIDDTIRIVDLCMGLFRDQNLPLNSTSYGINFNINFNIDEDMDPSTWMAQHFLSHSVSPDNSGISAQSFLFRIPNLGNSTFAALTFGIAKLPDYMFSCYANFHHEEVRDEIIYGQELEELIIQRRDSINDELRRLFNV